MGKKGRGRQRRRGCERCGNRRFSSGKWCHCNGFNASNRCCGCGQPKRGHSLVSRTLRNGRKISVSSCFPIGAKKHGAKKNSARHQFSSAFGSRNHFDNEGRFDEENLHGTGSQISTSSSRNPGCNVCGCTRHVDAFGDRVCWCDACSTQLNWADEIAYVWRENWVDAIDGPERNCSVCGCSQHVDDYGDRVCWCDACHDTFDWGLAWQSVRESNNERTSNDASTPNSTPNKSG